MEAIVDAMPMAAAILDHDLQYVAANRQWRTLWRLGDGARPGQSLFDEGSQLPTAWPDTCRRALAGHGAAGDVRVSGENGASHTVHWSITPWRDRRGRVRGVVIVVEDRWLPAEGSVRAAVNGLDSTAPRTDGEGQRLQTVLAPEAQVLATRERQMRQLALELTVAEQRERQRLARVLHDDLQQMLFGALLRLERLAAGRRRANDGVADHLSEVRAHIEDALAQARSLATQLAPPVVEQGGLAAAIRWLGSTMQARHGLEVAICAAPEAEPLSHELKIFVFDAVRELLFNVVKHAGVLRAGVRVEKGADGDVLVEVSDHGSGCDPQHVLTTGGARLDGLGIRSIRERLALLGGHLTVRSAAGQGTHVRLRVPRAAVDEET